jgi:WD40 repeat protein
MKRRRRFFLISLVAVAGFWAGQRQFVAGQTEAIKADTVRTDRYGDPLPPGAVCRLGTTRFRHFNGANTVRFSTDGKTVFTCGDDGLRGWEVATGKALSRLPNDYLRDLNASCLSPDTKLVLSFPMDLDEPSFRLWDVTTGQLVRQFGDHWVTDACFSPDGRTLATFDAMNRAPVIEPLGTEDPRAKDGQKRIALWEVAAGRKLRSWRASEKGTDSGIFSADGLTLITVADKAIHFWDVATTKELRRLEVSEDRGSRLVMSPDGKLLAQANPGEDAFPRDPSTGIWEIASGKKLQALTLPRSPETLGDSFAEALFTPDRKELVTVGNGRVVRLWDVATGKQRRRIDVGELEICCLNLSRDGKTLAGLTGTKGLCV